ncbi:MAG: T9SS type A sorting domain-containing protein [Bacteroidota bacterium]
MNRLYLLVFFAFAFQLTQAQLFNVHFSNPEVNDANSPTELCVDLELSYSTTATLGFSNFLFDYDEMVLSNPSIDQSYLNNEYTVSIVTTESLNDPMSGDVADLRIVYDFQNGTSALSLVGQSDCSVTTGIARLCFDITDANAITDLSWIYDGDGSSTATNVNTHIDSDPNTAATQLNANSVMTGQCSLTDITIDIPNTPDGNGGGSCATDLTYTTATTVAAGMYQVSNNIETGVDGMTVNVDIEAGATVVFDAGNAVILRAGFTAANGTTFTAKIGGCTPSNLDEEELIEARNEEVLVAQKMQLEVIPNPAFHKASIRFYNPAGQYVDIKIYDLNGKMVEHLHQQYAMKGWNQTEFYPSHLSSGIYFVSVQTKDSIRTERLVVAGE